MLTMMNHPRLLAGSRALDERYFPAAAQRKPTNRLARPSPKTTQSDVGLTHSEQLQAIEWLYLNTVSRRPTAEETTEAVSFVQKSADLRSALNGVLWMLVNRSEYVLVR